MLIAYLQTIVLSKFIKILHAATPILTSTSASADSFFQSRIFVSMDESDSNSDSDDKKKNKKSESLGVSDVAKEVVSVLKDRKKVVNGEDKTKTLDQKKLRDKVLDELNVKDGDLGEAKDLFEEALKKLKKKDEIKFDNDGDVKWVPTLREFIILFIDNCFVHRTYQTKLLVSSPIIYIFFP